MDDIKSRLSAYLKAKGVNKSEFGRAIGVSSAYITSIRKSIQPDKLDKIAEVYTDLNISWLLTGEGEMLKGSLTQTVGNIQGNAQNVNNVQINSDSVDKFLDEIAAQRRITEKCMDHIDRLIKLLEQKT